MKSYDIICDGCKKDITEKKNKLVIKRRGHPDLDVCDMKCYTKWKKKQK